MGMVEHAREELKYLRGEEPDEMQDLIERNIIEIVDTFAKQGHSGSSAAYCIPIINKLLKQEPISPLTGSEDEWTEIGEGVFQNKRFSSVFKDKDRFNGEPYWIEGKIFSDDGGESWFTNSNSFVVIKFPFLPKEPERIFIKGEN